MTFRIVNRPEVKADLLEAVQYYNQVSPALTRQFLGRIREAKEFIMRSPLGFQVKYNDVRTLLLKQFPFHIHYLIDENEKQIVIIAIIHAYKNPQDYSSR